MNIALPPAFDGLSDNAMVRAVPIEGGLDDASAAPVLAVVEELLGQWKERQVITNGAVAIVEHGYFLIVAWDLAGGDLSGCTKDGLTHALLALEKSLGKRMLNAPRLAVAGDGSVRFLDNAAFKEERRAGTVTDESVVFDHLVTTLGDVRAGKFRTTVTASWYDRVRP